MKGTYALVIRVPNRCTIKTGRLGVVEYKKGYYAYAGSAMNGLEARITRHLNDEKRVHWHVDYLLGHAEVTDVYLEPGAHRRECEVARMLNDNFESIRGFGSSDCTCDSHLFYSRNKNRLRDVLVECQMRRQRVNKARNTGIKTLNMANS